MYDKIYSVNQYETDRQTDRQNRLFDQKKLHTIIVQINDQETATKTKVVAIVAANF